MYHTTVLDATHHGKTAKSCKKAEKEDSNEFHGCLRQERRDWVLIEMKPEYAAMSHTRIDPIMNLPLFCSI